MKKLTLALLLTISLSTIAHAANKPEGNENDQDQAGKKSVAVSAAFVCKAGDQYLTSEAGASAEGDNRVLYVCKNNQWKRVD